MYCDQRRQNGVVFFVSYCRSLPSISLFLERTCVCKLLGTMFIQVHSITSDDWVAVFLHTLMFCLLIYQFLKWVYVLSLSLCVVNLTVTFVNFIKTSFQIEINLRNPGTPVVRAFIAMALGSIPSWGTESGKLCIAAKKKKKWICMCVCVCVYGRERLFIELITNHCLIIINVH